MPRAPISSTTDRKVAAAVFAVLVLAAALLFGAVDRSVQLGLVFGLGLGFLIYPPEVPEMPGRGWAVAGLAGFVVLSQFLPSSWFGHTQWHEVLQRDYDVAFPFTRNPEPGRALDCVLMGVIAVGWFFWVQTLACDSGVRIFLIWALFTTAATVAVVSLALGTRTDFLIYGVRYSPGWTGFGPFPNRNHTAALLAMGALSGAGCLVRGARRKYWVQLAAAVAFEIAIIMALLESKSRGGLLGLGCGLALFALLAVSKLRSRGAVAGVLAGGLLCATLVLSFGSKVLARFQGPGDGNIPNNLRWEIWQDAIKVWHDAPLWGHGLGTFAQIFPLYQTVEAHEQIILHPESSWLQWLDELGAIPVGIGAILLIYFIVRNAIGAVRVGDRGLFLRAGAFAGVTALLCHGIWDVPVHRWGTAAFGIALLAIACPPLHRRRQLRLDRLWAGAPLAIGLFWLLPFIGYPLKSSPEATRQLLAKLTYSPTAASLDDLKQVEAEFPLNPQLHEQVGLRELFAAWRQEQAWREFRVADRLVPGSWAMPALQGWLSREVSAGVSFHFWSLAIERADRREPELYLAAYRNSLDRPGGEEYWRAYAQGHPELLLSYAQNVASDAQGKAAYDEWWNMRGNTSDAAELWERPDFYSAVRKWGNRAQMLAWIKHRPGLEKEDFKSWASILHEWQMDQEAWQILARQIKEPDFPKANTAESMFELEADWRGHPDDPIIAQTYARECAVNGETAKSEGVIMSVAAWKNPPPWFVEKAAFISAARKDYPTAVTSLLRLDMSDTTADER
jgi:O-antigen ligase